MRGMPKLDCFCCGKSLDEVFPEDVQDGFTPYAGTKFYTYGHYGSTFWDSLDGEMVFMVMCDECLRSKPDRVAYMKKVRDHPARWEPFTPGEEV